MIRMGCYTPSPYVTCVGCKQTSNLKRILCHSIFIAVPPPHSASLALSMATSNAQSDGAGSAAPKIWQDGSCHCGAVTFKVLHEPLEESIPIRCCNCSICHKKGYLTIYPERKEIEWLSGWDGMKNYRFGTETRDHKFCDVCGSSICIDFLGKWSVGDVIGINVS